MKRTVIILAALFLFPIGALAKGNWMLTKNKNTLALRGACPGKEMKVELFREGDSRPVYISGAVCEAGRFDFSDNLTQWESLGDGQYSLVVNGAQENLESVFVDRPALSSAKATDSPNSSSSGSVSSEAGAPAASGQNSVAETPISSEAKFLEAFVTLQNSILDMQKWLDKTSYSAILKNSLGMALDGLDVAVGKVSGLVLSAEESATYPAKKLTVEPGPADSMDVAADAATPTPTDQVKIPWSGASADSVRIDLASDALKVD